MNIGWGSIRRAAIAGVVLFGLVGAVQASPVAADGGGNSTAARACQEGYSSLVGVQDGQITTFDTPGACVAYAAQGGRIVAASVVQPCLHGGFSDLATSEDSTTAFSSEAACVSYAAGGGTLVRVVVGPVFDFVNLYEHGGYACIVDFHVSGLTPGTYYTFVDIWSNGEVGTPTTPLLSDSWGVVDTRYAELLVTLDGGTFQVQTMLNGVAVGSPSQWYTASC